MKADTSPVTVRLLDEAGAFGAPIQVPKIVKSDEAWRAQLTDEQFRVTRTHGTERAFCGIFHDNHQHGLYTCVASAPKQPMKLEVVDLGPFDSEEVEIAVEHCGLCHSDLSILNDEWGLSQYPAILGHEVVGRITAIGPNAKGLRVGQRVGVGWHSGSCMHCRQCMSGSHHLCPQVQFTIVGHRGGFASHVRTNWAWAIPLPEKLNPVDSGPLLCGGITVFAPLAMHARPTSRVGIIGIGGLGHMAVKFPSAPSPPMLDHSGR